MLNYLLLLLQQRNLYWWSSRRRMLFRFGPNKHTLYNREWVNR